jgi:hypothetical protein
VHSIGIVIDHNIGSAPAARNRIKRIDTDRFLEA